MFCDLIGSTEMSQKLDPEELREINTAYQVASTGAIELFGGYVARYMGDGVLAYFGYPQAHEDDAERAVLAGLAIVEAITAIKPGTIGQDNLELAVRVGVATGPVVVGDLIGEGAAQEKAVVGETPNLAARLQGIADPNQVIVSSETQMLGDQ
jgi:class 3 adenylate cyclase